MFSEPLLKNASVDVSTHGGVVTLAGRVPDDAAHLAAYKIATAEKGVTQVNDQINVTLAPAEPGLAASTPEPAARPSKRTRASRSSRAEEARRGSESAPASQGATEAASAAPAPPPPPQPITVTVPANTLVTVRMTDSIDSRTNRAGTFSRFARCADCSG
jgi:BON domain